MCSLNSLVVESYRYNSAFSCNKLVPVGTNGDRGFEKGARVSSAFDVSKELVVGGGVGVEGMAAASLSVCFFGVDEELAWRLERARDRKFSLSFGSRDCCSCSKSAVVAFEWGF